MFTYEFLQNYWWFIIALLAGILVFLLFVQGGNALIFIAGKNEEDRRMIVNSTGRKWDLTFTTLVTFGGAFFASFPLFYSTSFSGGYWAWIIILITFVFQAVSYEFQNKLGNFLGPRTFKIFLTINGLLAPLFIGVLVGTFFTGSEFVINKDAVSVAESPIISKWLSPLHGLESFANPINLGLGLAVMFLSICQGSLYMINNIADEELNNKIRKPLPVFVALFLVTFLGSFVAILLSEGYAVNEVGVVYMEKYKYLNNLLKSPAILVTLILGVVLVLYGLARTMFDKRFRKGIWFSGVGTILVVLAIFFMAGYNSTAYYPSTVDIQSSLTIRNSSSSAFTLKTMAIVSCLIPFVAAYIIYAWRAIDVKSITRKEIKETEHKY